MKKLSFCQLKMVDGIAMIYLNNPPVNALSEGIRNEIFSILTDAAADDAIRALVFTSHDLPFSAGADIKEFSGPMKGKFFLDFYQAIESLNKPVIVGIHQYALGGGLEFSMMAHHRIAHVDARLGLPEVKLGLIPGGTGTMSLPRLVGIEKALDMILTSQPVMAQEALEIGLVDEVTEDVEASCLALAKKILSDKEYRLCSPLQRPNPVAPSANYFTKKRQALQSIYHGFNAPLRLLDCLEASVTLPIDQGIQFEMKQFMALITGDDAAGMRYGFLSQRLAAHVPGLQRQTSLDVKKVGIIGGGLMGCGIAMSFLNAGFSVAIVEVDRERLLVCRQGIEQTYNKSVANAKLSQRDCEDRMSRLNVTAHIKDVSDCDLVIEAVFESMDLKCDIFKELDRVCRPEAILASNTSGLDLNRIAAQTKRPEKVIGLHFFSPAHVMKLLEIVRGDHTDDETLSTALDLAKRLKKIGVVVGVCPGFVGNRMIFKYFEQVVWLLLRGCLPKQIDAAMKQYGFPMGPCEMADMSGLEIWVHANPKADSLIHAFVQSGRLGQKSNSGFYDYRIGKKTAYPSNASHQLIQDYAKDAGIKPQALDDKAIVDRLLCALINEGVHILSEKIALRASDIDTIYVHGYGFPIYRGGPMFYADQVGLDKIKTQLVSFQHEDPEFWSISPLLDVLIESNKKLNKVQSTD